MHPYAIVTGTGVSLRITLERLADGRTQVQFADEQVYRTEVFADPAAAWAEIGREVDPVGPGYAFAFPAAPRVRDVGDWLDEQEEAAATVDLFDRSMIRELLANPRM